MSEWEQLSWGDIATLEYGRALRGYQQATGPVRVYGTNGPVGWTSEAQSDGPGVIVGRKGAYRGVHYADQPFWVIDTAYFLRPKRELDLRWAYFALLNQDINSMDSGSAIPSTSRADFYALPVRVPPLGEQHRIADVLGALDDKIAANERIIRTADDLRALLLADFLLTQQGFIVDTPLSALALFVNGRAFTKSATGGGRMVVRIAEINSGPGASTVYNDLEVSDRHLARPGDVLFAWSGSLTVARWFRPEAIINQHIFKVIPKEGLPSWLVFELLLTKLARFRGIAADKATTMGHIQRHHLDETVTAPVPEAISTLDDQLGPLWNRALAAEQESLTLAQLRDTLLPGLMSGEIRIRDAEKAVEEVE